MNKTRSISDENLAYLVALHLTNRLSPKKFQKLLKQYKDPKKAWEAKADASLNPEKYLEEITKKGIKILTIFDQDYPELLKQIYDPPVVLYYLGKFPDPDLPKVAVVGSRKATEYGKIITKQLVSGLVQNGVVIVSGLARGIDTIAHETAVEHKGYTIAVLGSGLSKIFPHENTKLVQSIVEGEFGAVISEFPPDTDALPFNFPLRNRIIAGLSQAVLVTEAAEKSGSLITARLGLEAGRDIFAVPGQITSWVCQGTNQLIKNGAFLATSHQDILEVLGISNSIDQSKKVSQAKNLTKLELSLLAALKNEQKHIDILCRELKIDSSIASSNLIKMELFGLVKNLGSGIYISLAT